MNCLVCVRLLALVRALCGASWGLALVLGSDGHANGCKAPSVSSGGTDRKRKYEEYGEAEIRRSTFGESLATMLSHSAFIASLLVTLRACAAMCRGHLWL